MLIGNRPLWEKNIKGHQKENSLSIDHFTVVFFGALALEREKPGFFCIVSLGERGIFLIQLPTGVQDHSRVAYTRWLHPVVTFVLIWREFQKFNQGFVKNIIRRTRLICCEGFIAATTYLHSHVGVF